MTKYTPLVKSMQQDLKNKGFDLSLEQTYQKLLKANFIDADGQPTEWAIKNGYVGVEYAYPQGMQDNSLHTDLESINNSLVALNNSLIDIIDYLRILEENQDKELDEIARDCNNGFTDLSDELTIISRFLISNFK